MVYHYGNNDNDELYNDDDNNELYNDNDNNCDGDYNRDNNIVNNTNNSKYTHFAFAFTRGVQLSNTIWVHISPGQGN